MKSKTRFKQYILYFFLFSFILSCSNESNSNDSIPTNQCEGNNVTTDSFNLSNQSSIDAFLENNYSEVGGITVAFQSDLSFLECIRKTSYLHLDQCTITDLTDLSNLEEIQSLYITDCDNLINFQGISPINSLKNLSVEKSDSFINFSGLESLQSLTGSLEIKENNSLQNLEGLNNIISILADDSFIQLWYIDNNPNLTTIESLNNVAGDSTLEIDIRYCPSLSNLGSFDDLSKIYLLSILNCPQITSVNCFPNIIEAESISINDCFSINSIQFPSLNRLAYLDISNNENLTDLNFLSLTEFSGGSNGDYSMRINQNNSLVELSGFNNLINNVGIIEINMTYSPLENPLINICGIRNLILEQINSGTYENIVKFKTSCTTSTQVYANILDFDNNCSCE